MPRLRADAEGPADRRSAASGARPTTRSCSRPSPRCRTSCRRRCAAIASPPAPRSATTATGSRRSACSARLELPSDMLVADGPLGRDVLGPPRRSRRSGATSSRPVRGRSARTPTRSRASRRASRASAPRSTRPCCPAETGLVERAVSFTKGCYVGQEPVARLHYRGHPNRHLRTLVSFEARCPRCPPRSPSATASSAASRASCSPGRRPRGRPRLRPQGGRGGRDRGRPAGCRRALRTRGSAALGPASMVTRRP